ncbi:MAG: hypothetical protein LEGION0398_MBIBDBAK_00718 [Legionellaceae bacterium]
MAISDWPELERPREKLLFHGPQTLSDAELLAIFLRVGIKGKSAVDLARDLLNEFGGLRLLLESSQQQFCQHRGLGIAKYVQIQAVLEMSRRHLLSHLKRGDVIKNPLDTQRYLTACLRRYTHEVFACLFLDTRNRIICFEELVHGTLTSAFVHPREIVKRALEVNAASVILAHNHPSGCIEPSHADKNLTKQLQRALELVEIHVIDHIIIGDGKCTSFAEKGLL